MDLNSFFRSGFIVNNRLIRLIASVRPRMGKSSFHAVVYSAIDPFLPQLHTLHPVSLRLARCFSIQLNHSCQYAMMQGLCTRTLYPPLLILCSTKLPIK